MKVVLTEEEEKRTRRLYREQVYLWNVFTQAGLDCT